MAAARNIMEQLQSALTCYICDQSFLDPSTLDCGHNFCHSCIMNYLHECGPEAACPRCQEEITRPWLPLNRQLVNIVKLTGELADRLRWPAGWQRRCREHPEAPQSFCLDDLVLFCSACDTSWERLPHRVAPPLEAAQAYKYYFSTRVRKLKQEKEKISKNDSAEDTEYFKLLKRLSEEKNAVAAELEALQDFVAVQENFLLAQVMERTEKKMARYKDLLEARLYREEMAFDEIIRELEEKDNEPPLEFLRGIRSPMERSWRRFRPIQTFPVEFKMYLWEGFDFSAYLRAVAKQYKEIIVTGCEIQQANVILDPNTAHPRLILSEDCKSLRLGREPQDLPENDQRFDQVTCVLGREILPLPGRHQWDVITGRLGSWAVGVARRSLRRKGLNAFGPEEGIWVMFKSDMMYGFFNGPNYELEPVRRIVTRIRVSLNQLAGRITFCDPDSGVLIREFTAELLNEPLLPLFWICGKAKLSLVP